MSEVTQSSLPISEHQQVFCELVEVALQEAKKLGASDAAAEISESRGLSVSVRKQKPETVEQARERSLGVSVYAGQRRGTASTSDFSLAAIRETVAAAWHIARFTAEDPAAGLAADEALAFDYADLGRSSSAGTPAATAAA